MDYKSEEHDVPLRAVTGGQILKICLEMSRIGKMDMSGSVAAGDVSKLSQERER